MAHILKFISSPWGFAVLFLGPLFGECIEQAGWSTAILDPLWLGLSIAILWAGIAVWRGSWFWVRP